MKYFNAINIVLAIAGVLFCLFVLQTTYLGEGPDYQLRVEAAEASEGEPGDPSGALGGASRPEGGRSRRDLTTPERGTARPAAGVPPTGRPRGGSQPAPPPGGVVPSAAGNPSSPSADPQQGRGGPEDGDAVQPGPTDQPRQSGQGLRPGQRGGASSTRPVLPLGDRGDSKRDSRSPNPPRPRGSNQ